MRVRKWWLGGAVLTATLASCLLTSACSGPSASTRPGAGSAQRHPDVDTGLATCAECHAKTTPKVAAAWRDSRHGMSLVECVVCHGSTGADFKARPNAAGCAGCHPAQADARAAAPGCFSCHPAHALHAAPGVQMPHPDKPKEAVR